MTRKPLLLLLTGLLVSSLLIISGSSVSGTPLETEETQLELIRKAIQEQGAYWRAGKTSVSGLSLEEKKKLCGLKLLPHLKEGRSVLSERTRQVPSWFDWRTYNGSNWTTPIKSQGSCGSCWAFGSLAAVESMMEISQNNPNLNPNLSEQYLLSCSGGDCDGWYIDSTLDFLKNYGVVDESCFPYRANDRTPCSSRCGNWQSRISRIYNWGWVGTYYWLEQPAEAVKQKLLEGPLPTHMMVYEDFYYYVGGVYQRVWGEALGGHLITLVGWNDAGQYWICKNSWGTDWGENGWLKIRMGVNECEIGEYTAYIELEPPPVVLEVDPNFLDFGEVGKGAARTMTFRAYNSGAGTLSGSVSTNRDWITVWPTSFEGNDNAISVAVSTKGLKENPTPYTGAVTVSSNGGTKTVQVSVAVIPVGLVTYPNPFSLTQHKTVSFWGTAVPYAKIHIFTLAGELVRTLEERDGKSRVSWDSRNERGDRIARGVYFCVVDGSRGRIGVTE